MIAFGVIAICAAVLVINFQKSSQDRREKDSLDIVESKFRMAAQLAKITNGEISVVFDKVDGVNFIYFSSDINTSERMKTNLNRKTPLPNINRVEVTPSDDDQSVSFFPWGLENRDVEVALFPASGNGKKIICSPAKYAPNVVVKDAKEIDDLFPQEIVDDEEEEKLVHVD